VNTGEPPNTRVRQTHVARRARPGSPLTRHPLGGRKGSRSGSRMGESMSTELYRDEFGAITHDPERSVLELDWFERTAFMTDDDLKGWLERYTSLREVHRPAFMLIDARQFRHRFGPELAAWREERIIPRYNAAGVRKLAFILPKEFLPGTKPAPEAGAAFPTGYFDTRWTVRPFLERTGFLVIGASP
jgi:hypothetical protein